MWTISEIAHWLAQGDWVLSIRLNDMRSTKLAIYSIV
jgi:hypothetical protein